MPLESLQSQKAILEPFWQSERFLRAFYGADSGGYMKVIVRSNEYEKPFWLGDYQGRDASLHDVPVIINEKGETFYCLGIIVPYSEPLAQMLSSLSGKEQWDLLVNIKRFWEEFYAN
jgi:hypothetical protein